MAKSHLDGAMDPHVRHRLVVTKKINGPPKRLVTVHPREFSRVRLPRPPAVSEPARLSNRHHSLRNRDRNRQAECRSIIRLDTDAD